MTDANVTYVVDGPDATGAASEEMPNFLQPNDGFPEGTSSRSPTAGKRTTASGDAGNDRLASQAAVPPGAVA
jgi:hypothetical protein